MTYDCIVIGAGPAGIIAAIQLKRSGFRIALFEKHKVGGLLTNANIVENYLGFPHGIAGEDLVTLFKEQLATHGVAIIPEEVLEISDGYTIHTAASSYHARAVVIATGTRPKKAGLQGEEQLVGTKIFYEIAHLPNITGGQSFLIIGGGDVGFDYALNLNKYGHKALIACRGKARCLPLLKERARHNAISYLQDTTFTQIRKVGDKVELISDRATIDVDYVLIAVGREAHHPEIRVTNTKGLYFVGDVRNNSFRQIHIATGDALKAAMYVTQNHRSSTMDVIDEIGDEDLAKVYIGQYGEHRVEFAESIPSPHSLEEKWVLVISCLVGCPVRCLMCDAGRSYSTKLTKEQILQQVDYMVNKRFPNGTVPVKKFKVQFTRMGEPTFNDAVLDVLEELPKRYRAPLLIPCISTIGPKGCISFLQKLKNIKDRLYSGGAFQMQFSIHTTDQAKRDKLIPIKKLSFEEIAAFGQTFYRPGDRKVTLNFIVMEDYPIDPATLAAYFDPAYFLIKLTPLNPTKAVSAHSLSTKLNPHNVSSVSALVSELNDLGFECIVSIGDVEENLIGSNCGQYLS